MNSRQHRLFSYRAEVGMAPNMEGLDGMLEKAYGVALRQSDPGLGYICSKLKMSNKYDNSAPHSGATGLVFAA